MARRLDWPGLMRAGMGALGLRPDAFWRLTPQELALMLGIGPGAAAAPMNRGRLEALARAWPDKVTEERSDVGHR